MDIFRRLTTPTLKKLYRFVLQRLVGRFLDDGISLEQLDVHLRAGRIELTDLKINVKTLGELFPNLSFRLARAHVGRLRVEISYTKLLTESLTFFLDDVLIEIVPAPDGADGVASSPNENTVTAELQRPGHPEVTYDSRDASRPEPTSSRLGPTEKAPAEGGESLDFLAQWIEQITSKVKIIVHNLTSRIAASELLEGARAGGQSENNPFLEVRFSTLKWCDETPDSSLVVTERQPRPHTSKEGAERVSAPGVTITQKRLTLGVICAEWNGGVGRRKREVARMSGTGSIVIKHNRRPQPGSTPPTGVVDIDVSLRHADICLGAEDCAGLGTLSSAYLVRANQPVVDSDSAQDEPPVADINTINTTRRPLFSEDFWYFDGLTPPDSSSNSSSELNFDTLSRLLEEYSVARARLSEAGLYGQGVDTGVSDLSLEQSDVFYDCVEANDDGVGSGEQGGKEQNLQGSAKARMRMTGFDLTLLLAEEPLDRPTPNNRCSPSHICLQVRRLIHKLDYSGTSKHFNADVGTFAANFTDGDTARCVRMVEVGSAGATDSSPCIQVDYSRSTSMSGSIHINSSSRHKDRDDEREVTKVDVRCLPVSAVIDARWTGMLSNFVEQIRPQQEGASHPVDGNDAGRGITPSGCAEKARSAPLVDHRRVEFAVTVPKVSLRLPADPAACSSVAYTALISSVRNGTSPVGWTPREPSERAPALVAEVKDVTLTSCFGLLEAPNATLECSSVVCEMVLIGGEDVAGTVGDESSVMGLYFLEASRSVSETPLKVEYGRAGDMGNTRNSGEARSADTDLKFLHTWEPVDGVESGLGEGEVPPPVSFGGRRQGREGSDCSVAGGSHSPMVLLCDLPRLAVELSRLEVVVLGDILHGLSSPADDTSSARSASPDVGAEISAPLSVEVMVEARGATIVLHEAEAFAEEPGPYSYVLNLGSACLRVGGGDKSVKDYAAPLVTVSSGDACVHETLRRYEEDEHSSPSGPSSLSSGGRSPTVDPLLFLPGRTVSVYPSADDLASIGFVPVLYQTKWAKGTSPITAQLTLALSGPEAVCKTITATLNLYDVSLRYRVASSWLPRLLGLVVGDVPPGREASSNCEPVVNSSTSTNGLGESKGNLTKMFITVFNGVVDYMPQMQTTASFHGAPRKPRGVDRAREGDAPFTFTKGRVVLPIGVLRVSSNMVAGAPMQGFKVVIRDIGLHISNRLMDYSSEDSGLCLGALESGGGGGASVHVTRNKKELSSVQEYLERSYFVQIATLNFLDAFLRTRTQVVSPRDAFTAVELWMGVLHVYTCQDSLCTSQALLGEWCALVNECRAAAANLGQDVENDPKPRAGQVEKDKPSDIAPASLLDDVEQDAFVPGSNTESPNAADAGAKPGMGGMGGMGGMARVVPTREGDSEYRGLNPREQQSLLIEDYYCVAVEAPHEAPNVHNQLMSGSIPGDSREREPRVQEDSVGSGKHSGGYSSFISEGEGPAQWLVAPMTALEREEGLAMESAGESSDSEGEEKGSDGAKSLKSLGLALREQKAASRNNLGFSLPAPIEIELEDCYEDDRHDEETQDAKDWGGGDGREVLSSPVLEPSSPLFQGKMNESRPRIDSSNQDEPRDVQDVKATHISPQRLSYEINDAPQDPFITPTNNMQLDEDVAPVSRSIFTSQDTLALGKRADASDHRDNHERPSSGYLSEVTQDRFSAGSASPAKGELLKGEQEARWLTREVAIPSRSQGTSDLDTESPPNQTDEFRVYPHYIPIPATAEAASLPSLLSGNLATLQALGREPQDSGNQEAEADMSDMSERPKQKLQSQLAIHDLTICWRLFKGRDWGEFFSADKRINHDQSAEVGHHPGNSKVDKEDKVLPESQREPEKDFLADPAPESHRFESSQEKIGISGAAADARRPKTSELLDALLENYQDGRGGRGDAQTGRRGPRQLKVKRLNIHRDGGSTRSVKRTGRDTSCMLEVVLEHSSLRLDSYHPGPPPSLLSNLLLSVKDLYASDTLTSSRPRKAVQHWRDDVRHPRQFHQKMVTVRMTARSPSDHFCPEDTPLGDEIMLKVRLLPVHLSFGQHIVDFLRSFAPPAEPSPDVAVNRKRAGGVDDGEEGAVSDASPFFISCCDVGAFKVKIDYQPRAIKVRALQHGAYLELLNLFPLEGVQLTLDKLLLTGVSGWNGVAQLLLQSWVQDITSTQMHKFLAGTTAIRPLVTVGKGVADLVLLPVEQYRRDRRVLRGLRKGTQSFLRAVTIETLHTSHRVASFVARTLDDIVAQPGSRASLRGLEYYDEQPTGVLDSLEHAYDALAKEVQVAAQTIIAIPYEEQEEVIGPHGRSYVRSVARALPVAVLRPVVGASEALSCTLLGFRNYMSPVIRKEEEGRWR